MLDVQEKPPGWGSPFWGPQAGTINHLEESRTGQAPKHHLTLASPSVRATYLQCQRRKDFSQAGLQARTQPSPGGKGPERTAMSPVTAADLLGRTH